MKKIIISGFLLFTISAFSQRYLTYVYSDIDSIIGEIYGTSIDYLSLNQELLFDFYSPKLDTTQKRPLIIYIHGGGFTSGSRTYPSVKLLCRKMAMKGYTVANIDYRLDPEFNLYDSDEDRRAMTDAMHDAKQAIRYFKANAALYKIDTNNIFIGGESAGAITSMMAAYVDKQSEMAFYPKASPDNPVGNTSNSDYGNNVKAIMCLSGMIIDTTAIENSNEPPLLWLHGSADTFIPVFLANFIVSRAENIGLPIQTKLFYGATHCPWYYGNPNWEIYLDSAINEITSFLYPKVQSTIGLNEIQANEIEFEAYPNPCNSSITINLDKQYGNIKISLMTISGEVCQYISLQNTANYTLNLLSLNNGIYLLKIELDNNILLTKKITIIK